VSRASEQLFQAIFMAGDECAVLQNGSGENALAQHPGKTPGMDYVFNGRTQFPPNREQAT
jgi:hypothetical protein